MEKKSFLTIREKEIFELLVQNLDTEEIADKLKIPDLADQEYTIEAVGDNKDKCIYIIIQQCINGYFV